MSIHDNLFKKIQENSNINPEDIYAIAQSVKTANFSDEATVRQLVQQLSQLANKPISKEKEAQIIDAVTKKKFPSNFDSLNRDIND